MEEINDHLFVRRLECVISVDTSFRQDIEISKVLFIARQVEDRFFQLKAIRK